MNIQTFNILTEYTHSKYQPPGSQVMLDAGTFQSHEALSSTLFQFQLSSVQLLSRVRLFVTPWTAARQASLSSPAPGVYSNSCPLSQWCHPTISSSVIPFSSCLQSFPSIRVFSNELVLCIRWPKYWVSASASVFSMNIQDSFPLESIGFISLQSKGLTRVFFNTTVQKHQFFGAQLSLWFNSHIHTWLLDRP